MTGLAPPRVTDAWDRALDEEDTWRDGYAARAPGGGVRGAQAAAAEPCTLPRGPGRSLDPARAGCDRRALDPAARRWRPRGSSGWTRRATWWTTARSSWPSWTPRPRRARRRTRLRPRGARRSTRRAARSRRTRRRPRPRSAWWLSRRRTAAVAAALRRAQGWGRASSRPHTARRRTAHHRATQKRRRRRPGCRWARPAGRRRRARRRTRMRSAPSGCPCDRQVGGVLVVRAAASLAGCAGSKEICTCAAPAAHVQ